MQIIESLLDLEDDGGSDSVGRVTDRRASLGALYGVYGPLASMMFIFGTVNIGVGPGLSQRLTGLVLKNQEEEERQWFSNAFFTLGAVFLIFCDWWLRRLLCSN
ncbi:MAG: hypothetical protein R2688_00330 [Fimbriimonadaceae bacterium]